MRFSALFSGLRGHTERRHSHPEARKDYGISGAQVYFSSAGAPVWTPRRYAQFAEDAYARNVVAHRSVRLVADAVSSVPMRVKHTDAEGVQRFFAHHPLLQLLGRPNPLQGGPEFLAELVSYRLISGNAYILALPAGDAQAPRELHLLRPDRVRVIAGKGGLPAGYRHTIGQKHTDYRVRQDTGYSPVLHLKAFHPLSDWYGLSPVEAAAYSIDQHNQAGAWNQSLLQRGARPSGALVVKGAADGAGAATLSEEQYLRVKTQIDDYYSGAANAGRPMLLEGGLEWREMSISPRDMDFINAKHSAARDIALAFGVPPQLLGIPGDNTYSNLAEARLALWEQTVLPLMDTLVAALGNWLAPQFGAAGEGCALCYDADTIPALAPRREAMWERVKGADFLSDEEKRTLVGMGE